MSASSDRSGQASRQQSTLLPAASTAQEFGKVFTRIEGAARVVEFTIWLQELEGAQAEGWQTGVALDASASMKNWYGRNLAGTVPDALAREYEAKGWITSAHEDGHAVRRFRREAYEDAIRRGHLKFTENIVQPLAQDFIAYLAEELDSDGGTTVIYWACGAGDAYEVLGDHTHEQCRSLELKGPQKVGFGDKTILTPAVRYFVDRFADAPRGMYVFLTDGRLDDLEPLKQYTIALARAIAAGQRNPVKCVLVGVGDKVDEGQMAQLDNLETGVDVDIWDHKIAGEMRALSEIMVELVDENRVVAPTAAIYDAQNRQVARFSDGLPGRVSFSMPANSPYFELEVLGKRIRQSVIG